MLARLLARNLGNMIIPLIVFTCLLRVFLVTFSNIGLTREEQNILCLMSVRGIKSILFILFTGAFARSCI
jgi:hypothetical protein